MKTTHSPFLLVVGLLAVSAPVPDRALAQEKPKVQVQIPDPGVPEAMTMEGKFVRAAYNNEGYVILGYQATNRSVGEEWMLLEVGMTVLDKTPAYTLKREAISLDVPDGKTVPLPTVMEHREGDTRADPESRQGAARLDQLLPAERQPRLPHRLLLGPGFARDAVRPGRAQQQRALVWADSISRYLAASPTVSTG